MIGGCSGTGPLSDSPASRNESSYNSDEHLVDCCRQVSFDLVCQAMVNMGVVVGLGPITGQPLPLISMGGTSMVFTGLAVGIILSVSRGEQDQRWEQKYDMMK